MGAMTVVIGYVDAKHLLEVSASEDQDPVQALPTKRAHPALGIRVRLGCAHGRADDPPPLAFEHLVEDTGELGVPVPDEKATIDKLLLPSSSRGCERPG
jgi:hypothetical protein